MQFLETHLVMSSSFLENILHLRAGLVQLGPDPVVLGFADQAGWPVIRRDFLRLNMTSASIKLSGHRAASSTLPRADRPWQAAPLRQCRLEGA